MFCAYCKACICQAYAPPQLAADQGGAAAAVVQILLETLYRVAGNAAENEMDAARARALRRALPRLARRRRAATGAGCAPDQATPLSLPQGTFITMSMHAILVVPAASLVPVDLAHAGCYYTLFKACALIRLMRSWNK